MNFFKKYFCLGPLGPPGGDYPVLKETSVMIVIEDPEKRAFFVMDLDQLKCNEILSETAMGVLNANLSPGPDIVIIDSAVKVVGWAELCKFVREKYPKAIIFLLKGLFTRNPYDEEKALGIHGVLDRAVHVGRLGAQLAQAMNEATTSI